MLRRFVQPSSGADRVDDLLHTMKHEAELAPPRLRRKNYRNVAMLIVDEVGLEPMTRSEASFLFVGQLPPPERSHPDHHQQAGTDWPDILAGDQGAMAESRERQTCGGSKPKRLHKYADLTMGAFL